VIDAMGMLDLSRGLVDNNNCMIHDVKTLSVHALISFSLSPEVTPRRRQSRAAGQAWDTRKIDEDMLAYQISSLKIPNGDAESMAAGLLNMLGRICDATIPTS